MKKPSWMKEFRLLDGITLGISVLSLLASVVIGSQQVEQAREQAEMEEIFKPISYEIEEEEDSFVYTFGETRVERPYPKIRFTTGRPQEFSIIVVENGAWSVTSCNLSPTEEYSIGQIKTGMPETSFEAGTRYAYDYFFLYFKDAAGKASLDMIYYQIDLETGTVSGPARCSELELVVDSGDDPCRERMLDRYRELLEKVAALPEVG